MLYAMVGEHAQFIELKQKLQLSSKKPLPSVVNMPALQRYFMWGLSEKKAKTLTLNMPELLPRADSTVRALLPDVQWKEEVTLCATPATTSASTAAHSDLQSASSSQTTAVRPLPAQLPVQLPDQAISFTPVLAAVVVDLGLRSPAGQTCRLYVVQVQTSSRF